MVNYNGKFVILGVQYDFLMYVRTKKNKSGNVSVQVIYRNYAVIIYLFHRKETIF